MSGFAILSAFVGGADSCGAPEEWPINWTVPFRLCRTEAAGLGLVWRDEGSRKRRSSARAPGPARACGESWGDRPRGDFVRWVPKVAPPCELRAAEPGVLGPLTALNGFVGVGVSARVEAAMVGWGDRSEELEYTRLQTRVSTGEVATGKNAQGFS